MKFKEEEEKEAHGQRKSDGNAKLSGAKSKSYRICSLKKISDSVNEILSFFFYSLTLRCVQKPWITICAISFCCLICGAGWSKIEIETESVKLYAPLNSQAVSDSEFVNLYFQNSTRLGSNLYVVGEREGDNILSKETIGFIFDIEDELQRIGNKYLKQGILAYWQWNRTVFENDQRYAETLSQENVIDLWNPTSTYINQDSVMSGILKSGDGIIEAAEAFHLTWYHQNDAEEEEFMSIIQSLSYQGIVLHPSNAFALDEAFENSVAKDTPFVMVCCLLLTFYSCFVLSKPHPVKSRSYLGIVAVMGVILAVVAGFGLVMACGVPFSLVVNAVFFVSLGLGVDDAYVIVDAVSREQGQDLPVKTIVSKGLSVAGASIFLTSLTDFIAFMVGSTTTIPSLSAFAIFAGVTIFIVFIVQVTLFPAVVSLDLKRQRNNRVDVLCCKKVDEAEIDKADKACFCIRKESKRRLSEKIIGEFLPKLILHPAGKFVVIISAIILLIGGGYGISQLQVEFNDEWLVPDGHFLTDAYRIRDRYFQYKYMPVPIYTKQVQGGYYQVQDQLQSLLDEVRALDYVLESSLSINWFESFLSWNKLMISNANQTGGSNFSINSEDTFVLNLKLFLDSPNGKTFENKIVFGEDGSGSEEKNTIYATSIGQMWVLDDFGSPELVENMLHQRKIIENAAPDLSPIIYMSGFPYLEGLAVLYHETVRNILIACGCVFVVCLVVLANFQVAFMVLIILGMIDTCLLGCLWWIDDSLNTVTAINLLVSIGLSVDYSAHIAHSFLVSDESSRDERAKKSLQHIGISVFNGGFSTFLAILPCAASETYIFQAFFKMITLIVALGLFFGMGFLPVFLSLIGPPSYTPGLKKETTVIVQEKNTVHNGNNQILASD